jgi:hypothetical protein
MNYGVKTLRDVTAAIRVLSRAALAARRGKRRASERTPPPSVARQILSPLEVMLAERKRNERETMTTNRLTAHHEMSVSLTGVITRAAVK